MSVTRKPVLHEGRVTTRSGDRPKIAVICGSTRWRRQIADLNRRLTLGGYIVLAPGVFAHDGDAVNDAEKVMLDELHRRKIDMADVVYVVAPDNRIGDSTRGEIAYAKRTGKPVLYDGRR